MGHSSVQITLDRYAHVMPRLRSALAERMDAAYRDVPATQAVLGAVEPLGPTNS